MDILTLIVLCIVVGFYAAIIETIFGKSPYERDNHGNTSK